MAAAPDPGVGLDLALDDAQQAIADEVARFCAARCDDDVVKRCEGRLPAELWKELAELGVLALVTPDGEGGALELVAATCARSTTRRTSSSTVSWSRRFPRM